MKKYFTLVFLLAVCLTAVPANVNAITLDSDETTTVECVYGEEFSVDIPTGWGLKSYYCGSTSDYTGISKFVEVVEKVGYISYDHYVLKSTASHVKYVRFVIRPPDYMVLPLLFSGPFTYKRLRIVTKPAPEPVPEPVPV